MKAFCLLTTGRSGSTSFMSGLGKYPDIGIPDKQVSCPNNEIFIVRRPDKYWSDYAALSGLTVNDEISLARAFFATNREMAFAGFKTMPRRHRHFAEIVHNNNVQIITLVRRDVASTVASFIAAIDQRRWDGAAATKGYVLRYEATLNPRIDRHLVYIERTHRALAAVPQAIRLEYETLCDPAFNHDGLNAFFCRAVRLPEAYPPTDASHYVENWPAFRNYVHTQLTTIKKMRG